MWPFSKKKKIPAPQPPAEDLLKFPKPSPQEKEIPVEKPQKEFAPEELPPPPKVPSGPSSPSSFPSSSPSTMPDPFKLSLKPIAPFSEGKARPSFLRVQRYQSILNNLDLIKNKSETLERFSQSLERSEFNENKDYERLKNSLKRIHDSLLFLDDLIFKKP